MPCRTFFLVVSFGVVCMTSLRAQRDTKLDTVQARATIRSLEQEWLDTSDSLTLDRILADDFLHVVGPGQVIAKSQHIAWAVRHPRPRSRHAHFDALVVRIYGNAAVATGTVIVTDDATHTTSRNSFTDVFVYGHDRWRAVSAEETPIATTPPSTETPRAPTS